MLQPQIRLAEFQRQMEEARRSIRSALPSSEYTQQMAELRRMIQQLYPPAFPMPPLRNRYPMSKTSQRMKAHLMKGLKSRTTPMKRSNPLFARFHERMGRFGRSFGQKR